MNSNKITFRVWFVPGLALVSLFLVPMTTLAVSGYSLTTDTNCMVWDSEINEGDEFNWSGECVNGRAHGNGVLTEWYLEDGMPKSWTFYGSLNEGKLAGQGLLVRADLTCEVSYEDGVVNGEVNCVNSNGTSTVSSFANGTETSASAIPSGHQVPKAQNRELEVVEYPSPKYPMRLGIRGVGGTSEIEFTVNEFGEVVDLKVLPQPCPWRGKRDREMFCDSLGQKKPDGFDQASKMALQNWKFNPKIENGSPVSVVTSQQFIFEVSGDDLTISGDDLTIRVPLAKFNRSSNRSLSEGAGYFKLTNTDCEIWGVPKNHYWATWEGACVNGKASGYGTLTYDYVDGKTESFTGQLIEGKMNGRGNHRSTDGSLYEGEFKDHFLQGQGKLVKSSGHTYEGQFFKSKMHGEGTFVWPSGKRFEGEFSQDEMWNGTLTKSNGEQIYWTSDEGQKTAAQIAYDANLEAQSIRQEARRRRAAEIADEAALEAQRFAHQADLQIQRIDQEIARLRETRGWQDALTREDLEAQRTALQAQTIQQEAAREQEESKFGWRDALNMGTKLMDTTSMIMSVDSMSTSELVRMGADMVASNGAGTAAGDVAALIGSTLNTMDTFKALTEVDSGDSLEGLAGDLQSIANRTETATNLANQAEAQARARQGGAGGMPTTAGVSSGPLKPNALGAYRACKSHSNFQIASLFLVADKHYDVYRNTHNQMGAAAAIQAYNAHKVAANHAISVARDYGVSSGGC